MKKVMIVDDHVSMLDSLTYALDESGRYQVVGRISSAAYATLYYGRLRPDLIFMDVCTEGGASGLEATQEICQVDPEAQIIVMSGFDEITYAPRAREAGARAFTCKSKSLEYFVETADAVLRGETSYPEDKTIPMPMGETPLTAREMEVLRLMCKHLTNKEIAEELFISENTVKYPKANMLAKTGFPKAIDLAFYMISNGWINPLY